MTEMAPKRVKQTPAPSHAAAVKPKAALIDAPELNALAARGGRRRTLDEVINKCLVDNFRTATKYQVEMLVVDGLTLRQRLERDKATAARNKTGGQGFGASYYRNLRQMYASETAPETQLVVKRPGDVVTEELTAALKAFRRQPSDRAPLIEWLASRAPASQREAVGVLRVLATLVPHRSCWQLQLGMAMLRWMSRNNIPQHYPEEAAVVRKCMDDILCTAWCGHRKQAVLPGEWWKVHAAEGALLLPAEDVVRVLQEQEKFAAVEPQLRRLCGSANLGRKMFGFPLNFVVHEKVKDTFARVLLEHFSGAGLGREGLRKMKDTVKAEVLAVSAGTDLGGKRVIVVPFHNTGVEIQVWSLSEELDCRCAALVKERAMVDGDLAPLWAEKELAADSRPLVGKVQKEVYEPFIIARTKANELLSSEQTSSADAVRAFLDGRKQFILSLDATAVVELSWMASLLSSKGEQALQASVLRALPGDKVVEKPSVEAAISAVDLITASALLKMSPASAQGAVSAVREMLAMVHAAKRPDTTRHQASTFAQAAVTAIGRFCTAPHTSGKGFFVGRQAAEAIHKIVAAKFAATPEVCSLADVSLLQVFGWLLPKGHNDEVAIWTAAIHARVGLGTPSPDENAVKRKGGAAKACAKRMKADQLDEEVAGYFG